MLRPARAALACLVLAAAASAQDPPGWTSHDVSTTTIQAFGAAPADVDGDGDVDVFAAGFNDQVEWHENLDGAGTQWAEHTIADATFVFSIDAADLNGDGDVDLIVGSSGPDALVWYENRFGDGTGWIRHVIQTQAETVRFVHADDMDGDGDLDIVVAVENTDFVTFWRNLDGVGTAWAPTVVGIRVSPLAVDTGDIDGDGDRDVLAIYSVGATVSWYENVFGNGGFWTEHVIITGATGGHGVALGDVDGDGDVDGVSCSFGLDLLALHRNGGGGTGWGSSMIPTASGEFVAARMADLDLDGDMDVVTGSFTETGTGVAPPIVWHENVDGAGTTWRDRAVSGTPAKVRVVRTVDLDGDCDVDIVAATSTDDRIAWFENTAPLADCDGNGVGDVCDIASGAEADCNGNGVPDSCDLVVGSAVDDLGFGLGGLSAAPWVGPPNDVPDGCEFPPFEAALPAPVAGGPRLEPVAGGGGASAVRWTGPPGGSWLLVATRPDPASPTGLVLASRRFAAGPSGEVVASLAFASPGAGPGPAPVLSLRALRLDAAGRVLATTPPCDVVPEAAAQAR